MKQEESPTPLPFCRHTGALRLPGLEALGGAPSEPQVPGGTSCFASASAERACGSSRLRSNRGLSPVPLRNTGSVTGFGSER